MKILYLAHRIPYPPNKGDKLRSYHQLAHLAGNHDVYLASFVDDPHDMQHADVTAALCKEQALIPLRQTIAKTRGAAGLLMGGTVTESAYRSRAMRDALSNWQRLVDFDVAFAFSSSMAPYALSVPADRHVLDMCDLDSHKWTAYGSKGRTLVDWMYRLEGQRLARREVDWIRTFDATILISDAETQELKAHERAKVHVIGNGVHMPEPLPRQDERRAANGSTIQYEGGAPILGFVGVMDYRPNVEGVTWFVESIWPGIREAIPHAEFRIIGRSPTAKVLQLGNQPGVTVVGGVEKIEPELARLTISVAPLRMARGVQNKVLEAMAHGLPVVATPEAALGIGARSGQHLLTTPDATGFIQAVKRLAGSQALRRRLGLAARQFVQQQFQWKPLLDRFEQLVCGVNAPATLSRRLVTGQEHASAAVERVPAQPSQ
ncbi:MAG: TIGR03087 family PEP-CTERM/XrtA system glycosyltransferase [Phycisphaerae bacterium]